MLFQWINHDYWLSLLVEGPSVCPWSVAKWEVRSCEWLGVMPVGDMTYTPSILLPMIIRLCWWLPLSKIFSPQWEYSPLDEGATSSIVNIQLCFSWLVELESSASVRLVEWSFELITWNYHHAHWYYHLKGKIPLMGLSPLACDS